MKNLRRRIVECCAVAALSTVVVGAVGQEPSERVVADKWPQTIGQASLAIESMSEHQARVTVRGKQNQEMTIVAEGFDVSTTPDGLKVTARGMATLSSRGGGGRSPLHFEAMVITIARDGEASIASRRIIQSR
jgi:hypothetical protein